MGMISSGDLTLEGVIAERALAEVVAHHAARSRQRR
jgi:hypothetical protein